MLPFHGDKEEQQVRDNLVRYYSSCSASHGSYILAVALGVFTFIQTITPMKDFLMNNDLFNVYLNLSSGFSLFISIGSYLLLRSLFWGSMTFAAHYATPMGYERAKQEFGKIAHPCEDASFSLSYSLHLGSLFVVKKCRSKVYLLSNTLWTIIGTFLISEVVLLLLFGMALRIILYANPTNSIG